MTLPNNPYVQIDIILPSDHDIMIISNNEECFDIARKVISSNPAHVNSGLLSKRSDNWTSNEKFKEWVDIKSDTSAKELLPSLVEAVRQEFLTRQIVCEVLMTPN